MDPQAVGFRLDKLTDGPRDGLHPVLVCIDQGLAGASPREPVLVGANELEAGGLNELSAPDFNDFFSKRPDPSQDFKIDKFIVLFDRSPSMGSRISRSRSTFKIDHARGELSRFKPEEFPDTEFILIAYDNVAQRIPLQDNDLNRAVASLHTRGGTEYAPALEQALPILAESHDPESPGRNVVLFITDGQDYGDRQKAEAFAREARGLNAVTYMVGVGADQGLDQANIFRLGQPFGFYGWAHTPVSSDRNVFELDLPEFFKDLRSAEHYLKIHCATISSLYGLTPAAREADDGTVFIGYQNRSLVVGFDEGETEFMQLEVGSSVNDRNAYQREVPIYDFNDPAAAAYFDLKEEIRTRDDVTRFLLLLASLDRNVDHLQSIVRDKPQFQSGADSIVASIQNPHDDETRMTASGTVSDLTLSSVYLPRSHPDDTVAAGDKAKQTLAGQPAVPPSLESGDKSQPFGASRSDDSLQLHSGALGPLDQSFKSDLPPADKPDAAAYDHVQPVIKQNPTVMVAPGAGGKDLRLTLMQSVVEGENYFIGRQGSVVNLKIQGTDIQPVHAYLTREANEIFVLAVGSTYLNGERLDRGEKKKLWAGDTLKLQDVEIKFST